MPNITIEVGHLYGENMIGVNFMTHQGSIGFKCGATIATAPYYGAELDKEDIKKFIEFFQNSLREIDNNDQSDLGRST